MDEYEGFRVIRPELLVSLMGEKSLMEEAPNHPACVKWRADRRQQRLLLVLQGTAAFMCWTLAIALWSRG